MKPSSHSNALIAVSIGCAFMSNPATLPIGAAIVGAVGSFYLGYYGYGLAKQMMNDRKEKKQRNAITNKPPRNVLREKNRQIGADRAISDHQQHRPQAQTPLMRQTSQMQHPSVQPPTQQPERFSTLAQQSRPQNQSLIQLPPTPDARYTRHFVPPVRDLRDMPDDLLGKTLRVSRIENGYPIVRKNVNQVCEEFRADPYQHNGRLRQGELITVDRASDGSLHINSALVRSNASNRGLANNVSGKATQGFHR